MPLQRIIRESIYRYNRRKKRANGTMSVHVINYNDLKNKKRVPKRRQGGYMYSDSLLGEGRKLIGIVFVLLGVILLFTKCFRSDSHSGSYEATVTNQVAVEEEMLPSEEVEEELIAVQQETVVSQVGGREYQITATSGNFAGYYIPLQNFEIEEKTYKDLISLSNKYQRELDATFAIWLVETTKGEKFKYVEDVIKGRYRDYELMNYMLYEEISSIYKQFIYDIRYFPIKEKKNYEYSNTWGEEETHFINYGINIKDKKEQAGRISVYSMSDGVVEKAGWSAEGGYRVGIRSTNGSYIYYGHLNQISNKVKVGETIKAGTEIGTMGNSGGIQEGVTGMVPVQLHIAIAATTKEDKLLWINPYPILRYVEANKLK